MEMGIKRDNVGRRQRPDSSSCLKKRIVRHESMADYLALTLVPHLQYVSSLSLSEKELSFFNKLYENPEKFLVPLEYLDPVTSRKKSQTTAEEKIFYDYETHGVLGPYRLTASHENLINIKNNYRHFNQQQKMNTPHFKISGHQWKNRHILSLALDPGVIKNLKPLLGENIKINSITVHEVPAYSGTYAQYGDIHALGAHSDINGGLVFDFLKNKTILSCVETQSINVWISITGTCIDNAPLFVFPKTHHWEVISPLTYLKHAKQYQLDLKWICQLLSLQETMPFVFGQRTLNYQYLLAQASHLSDIYRTDMYTQPGEYIIFNSHLMHGSGINRTSTSRLAVSVRYSRATQPGNKNSSASQTALNALKASYSPDELTTLGISLQADAPMPILQVSGEAHHADVKPVHLERLLNMMKKKEKLF